MIHSQQLKWAMSPVVRRWKEMEHIGFLQVTDGFDLLDTSVRASIKTTFHRWKDKCGTHACKNPCRTTENAKKKHDYVWKMAQMSWQSSQHPMEDVTDAAKRWIHYQVWFVTEKFFIVNSLSTIFQHWNEIKKKCSTNLLHINGLTHRCFSVWIETKKSMARFARDKFHWRNLSVITRFIILRLISCSQASPNTVAIIQDSSRTFWSSKHRQQKKKKKRRNMFETVLIAWTSSEVE